MRAIWKAQGKACAVCGVRMVPVHIHHFVHGWTFEHVFPRSSRRYHSEGNRLVTHAHCNSRKGNREPTGCEVILLYSVNAQLGLELIPQQHVYSDNLRGPSALALAMESATYERP